MFGNRDRSDLTNAGLPNHRPHSYAAGSHGRKANLERNQTIAVIVGRYDGRWWNGSSFWKPSLSSICADLDRAQIAVPSSWLRGRTLALVSSRVDVRGWEEALDLGFTKLIVDEIRYRLGRILRT